MTFTVSYYENGELKTRDSTPEEDAQREADLAAIVPPAQPLRHITTLAFDNRFTQDELVALELASIDNPAGTTEQRELAANLRIYQRKVDRATYIDLDRADTRAGVLALEQFGVLAAGRAAEILDAEVADIERVPA